MNARSVVIVCALALGMLSGAAWAGTVNPVDTRGLCAPATPATTGPLTREQVIHAMNEQKANGCWELSQFHYPAPYDAPLRAHVLAMQQAAARNGSAQ